MLSSESRSHKTNSYDIRAAIETLYVNSANDGLARDGDVNANVIMSDGTPSADAAAFSYDVVKSDVTRSADDVAASDGSSVSADSSCDRRVSDRSGSSCDRSDGSSGHSAVTVEVRRQWSLDEDVSESIFVECTTDDAEEGGGVPGRPRRRRLSQLFRRLSTSERQATREDARRTAAALADVRVDRLPQQCLARYLGARPCSGLAGARHVRGAVEELVEAADKRGTSIAAIHLLVSHRGIHVVAKSVPGRAPVPAVKCPPGRAPTAHVVAKSTHTAQAIESSLTPVESVSYGVQDPKYRSVFCFVRVLQLTTLECHAFVCESPVAARRMALALTLAFQQAAATPRRPLDRVWDPARRRHTASILNVVSR